jgi:hypothetical protein
MAKWKCNFLLAFFIEAVADIDTFAVFGAASFTSEVQKRGVIFIVVREAKRQLATLVYYAKDNIPDGIPSLVAAVPGLCLR